MKKVLALVLAVIMCIGVFASCGGDTTDAKGRVYWLNFSVISLLIEIKQNIFQLVDNQFSDDWMPFK